MDKNIIKECWYCKNKRAVSGNTHIKCVKPDAKMTGNNHGIEEGWFMYPFLFDPVWKTKRCSNFEAKNSDAISDAVSGVVSESKSH